MDLKKLLKDGKLVEEYFMDDIRASLLEVLDALKEDEQGQRQFVECLHAMAILASEHAGITARRLNNDKELKAAWLKDMGRAYEKGLKR